MSTRTSLLDDESLRSIGRARPASGRSPADSGRTRARFGVVVLLFAAATVGISWQLGLFQPSKRQIIERQIASVSQDTLDEQARQDRDREQREREGRDSPAGS